MKGLKTVYVCSECRYTSPKWLGKCVSCGAWNSFVEDVVQSGKQDGVNVYIGSENPLDETHNSSLVFKTISAGERVLGAIGVIGPRRMDYSKVITTVEYLSQSIAQMMSSEPNALPPKQQETEQ